MTNRKWFALLMIVMAPQAYAAPLEAYARLPLYENVAISPDGTKAAFVTTVGDEREIVIQPLTQLSDSSGISRIKTGKQKIRDLDWLGDGQLLITISQSTNYLAGEQGEKFAISNFDLKQKAIFSPMTWADQTWDSLNGPPIGRMIDGKPVLFMKSFAIPRIGERFLIPALYRADLSPQTTRVVEAAPTSEPKKTYSWAVDARGHVVVQFVYDEDTKAWSLALNKNGVWKTVQSEKALIEIPSIVGFGPEEEVVTIKKKENDRWILKRLRLTDGKWGENLSDEKCCGARYLTDPKTHRLFGYSWMDSRLHYVFFSKEQQEAWDQVVQSLAGEELILESFSDNLDKMVVKTFGKTTGAGYVLVDLKAKQLTRVGNLYRGIEAADIATVKPISYEAADGRHLSGYLTLPNGRAAKNLPLIVLPHGGPASRDLLEFEWLAQGLASKGYLVLQPNFRGSWGLGLELEEAGYGEWGRKMQSDLSDGVKALTKLGIADPNRVCIVGGSYGGYAALNGITKEADVYRCAVSVAGISDLKKLLEDQTHGSVLPETRGFRYLLRYLGATNENDPIVADRSPVMHVVDVIGPVLLIHGDNDSVVPLSQSLMMAEALKKSGKSYELVKLKLEDHWLSKADTRLQTLQAVVKFLETNNPP